MSSNVRKSLPLPPPPTSKIQLPAIRKEDTSSQKVVEEVEEVEEQGVTMTQEEYEAFLVDRERVSTLKHIHQVQHYLHKLVRELIKRAEAHDKSKLEPPEAELFAVYGGRLKDLEYGSDEYKENLDALKPALDHHYANNRHHPEHFKNGIEDMNLVDILEMLCDWKASSERQNGGNLRKSLEENAKRFNMDPMLVRILENTIDKLTE